MTNLKKTVLIMCQPDDYQGKVWQLSLETQMLKVIVKNAGTDLIEFLSDSFKNSQPLLDLILIDISIKNVNSGNFLSACLCTWAAKNYPALKIVVFNPKQEKIKEIERTWAIRRGAIDVFPSLNKDNLVTYVSQLTSILDCALYPELLEVIIMSMPTSCQSSFDEANTLVSVG